MPDGNPYDKLTEELGIPNLVKRTFENPYDELFAQTPRYSVNTLPPSLAGLFVKGVGKGILRPLTIFGVGVGEEEEQELTTVQKVTEVAGEFLGFGVGFLPLLKGAQIGLKAIGLLRPLAPEVAKLIGAQYVLRGMGATRAGVLSGKALEGALGFGLFEAGAAERLEDVPGHFATGAAIGAGAEIILGGMALAWRKRFKQLDEVISGDVSPVALHLETQMLPPNLEGGLEAAQIRLTSLGNPAAQLDDVAARWAKLKRPGGVGIIPLGSHSPAGFTLRLQEHLPKSRVWTHKTPLGEYEVLIADTGPLGKVFPVSAPDSVVKKFMGRGEAVLTPDEAVALIRADRGLEAGIDVVTDATLSPRILGDYVEPKFGGPIVRISRDIEALTGGESAKHFSTIVHEYGHHWETLITGRDTVGFRWSEFAEHVTSPDLKRLLMDTPPGDFSAFALEPAVEGHAGLIGKELTAASESLLKKMGFAPLRENWSYYGENHELLSRTFELMFVDPAKAQEVAPTVVRVLTEVMDSTGLREKLGAMLSRREHINVHNYLWKLWERDPEGRLQFFRQTQMRIGEKQGRQFMQEGGFGGMEVIRTADGKSYEWGRRVGDRIRLRDPRTGTHHLVDAAEVQRPTFPSILARSREVEAKIQEMMDKPLDWLAVKLFDEEAGGVRTGIIELGNFDTAPSIPRWLLTERRAIQRTGEQAKIQDVVDMLGEGGTMDDLVSELLSRKGKDGIILHDRGRVSLFLREPTTAVKLSPEARSPGFVPVSDGYLGQYRIHVSNDSHVESVLRAAGVQDRELAYFKSHNRFRSSVEEIVDSEFLVMEQLSATAAAEARSDLATVASRTGVVVDETTAGDIRLMSQEGIEIARFGGPEAERGAQKYIANLGPPLEGDLERYIDALTGERRRIRALINEARAQGRDDVAAGLEAELELLKNSSIQNHRGGLASAKDSMLDEHILPSTASQVPTDTAARAGGVAPPPRPSEQLATVPQGFIGKVTDSANIFGAMFTNMETLSKSFQRQGVGPMFSRVFEPAQEAILAVDRELAGAARKLLRGRTFNQQLRIIEKMSRKLPADRQKVAVQYLETLSREEVAAPGGLLVRGMTEEEVTTAKRIIELGLGDDVPTMMAALRLAKRASQRMEIPLEEAIGQLSLTDAQKEVIGIVQRGLGRNKNEFSIYAVSRYASAKPLGKGFKTGRDQFAAEMKLTSSERSVADELERLFDASFEGSELSTRRYLGGYFPHIRKWAEQGFFGETGSGGYRDFFKEIIPDEMAWTAARFRTGELDPYMMDPVMVGFKHIRGMLMNRYFDPILPDIKKTIATIRKNDPRAARIASEYISELVGRPHASFEKLDRMVRKSAEVLGYNMSDDLARNIINNLSALSYGATIPFRAGLIGRNYFQLIQTILPRTGPKAFFEGIQRALTKDGWKEAVDAGVITTNVAPVHATTEVFGFASTPFARKLQTMTQMGFRWYQKADDFGRAVAHHAQKIRMNRYVDSHMQGKITYERFKELGKVMTFDPIDVAEFDRIWATGRFEEAKNLLGNRLARETIFRYGHANHPAGWGGAVGRLFGQFGTWPVQYKDFLLQGLARGTTKDRIEFAISHGAINASVVAAGGLVGVNLASWVTFPSLDYTGGPFADAAIDLVRLRSGSPTERRMAWSSIKSLFPTLDDPRSIFIPGSYMIGDLFDAAEEKSPASQFLRALGVRMMRPGEKTWLDHLDF